MNGQSPGTVQVWWGTASCALMLLGAFGPWIGNLDRSVSGTEMWNDGWLVAVAAALALIGLLAFPALSNRARAGILAVAGAISTAVTSYDRRRILNAVEWQKAHSQLFDSVAHVGWGLTLSIGASISLVIAAVSLFRVRPE